MKLNLLLKQCQLSQNQEQGITLYYSPKQQNPFVTTLTVPIIIKPKLSLISSYIYLPKGHGNNIRLIIMGFLEVGFDKTHSHIIDKIKQFLYSNKTTFTDVAKNQVPDKIKNNFKDEHLKKVLMQFFNLVASHQYPTAHVYSFIQAYPLVLFIFELLFRKILQSLGMKTSDIIKQEIPTSVLLESLAKFFDCLFQRAEENVYWIARKVVFLEDKSSIYKNKFDQQGADKMLVNFDLDEEVSSPTSSKFEKQFQLKIENSKTPFQKSSDTNNSAWMRSQSGSRLMTEQEYSTKTQPSDEKRNSHNYHKKDSLSIGAGRLT